MRCSFCFALSPVCLCPTVTESNLSGSFVVLCLGKLTIFSARYIAIGIIFIIATIIITITIHRSTGLSSSVPWKGWKGRHYLRTQTRFVHTKSTLLQYFGNYDGLTWIITKWQKVGRSRRRSSSLDSYSYKFGRRLVDNLLPRKVRTLPALI